VRLTDLIDSVDSAYGDVWVDRVVSDSRLAGPAELFVARKGTAVDGHSFIADAAMAGCAAVIGGDEPGAEVAALLRRHHVPYLRVRNPARALGELSARINGDPSRALTVVGVTGTNGKTTVATLLYQLFGVLGHRCGLIATTGIRVGRARHPTEHTTPDPVVLQRLLATMVQAGCTHCFMEVTSHGIDQQRIAGIEFDGGIFSSLDHDHLDYHGTIEAYTEVKRRFLANLPASAFALANADETYGRFMVRTTAARVVFYGHGHEALLPWSLDRCDEKGSVVRIANRRVRSRLLGEHNASNLAAVVTAASLLGEDLGCVLRARGRMQRVATEPVLGIVDYAHTPESLSRVLASARSLRSHGRLIVVGGCGGDRDPSKRAAMGAAIATADVPIFTSDNPRSEDPRAIVEEMLGGVAPAEGRVRVEPDRRGAIEQAVRAAAPGDVILLVGKGHETSQEVAGTKYAWDDAAELHRALTHARTLRRAGTPEPQGAASASSSSIAAGEARLGQ
jgi:UDP-N-acetylmuramoyl-L-alanyl-D-glutamate--2,6-diaminopimelate ligase